MRKFGLIGYPLGHSFSKTYFTEKFEKEQIADCEYSNYPLLNINELPFVIQSDSALCGLNVTIPYKQQVISYIDELDKTASEVGAVNSIKIVRKSDGKILLKGFNTDVVGFAHPLKGVITEKHKSALILGTGGASKAVEWVLKSLGISYRFVSREPKDTIQYSYAELTTKIISDNLLIINTSPVGMYPNTGSKPNIPYAGISSDHILYDLVYNPLQTLFLLEGAKKKATTINGLPMLYAQAEKAWEIWNL